MKKGKREMKGRKRGNETESESSLLLLCSVFFSFSGLMPFVNPIVDVILLAESCKIGIGFNMGYSKAAQSPFDFSFPRSDCSIVPKGSEAKFAPFPIWEQCTEPLMDAHDLGWLTKRSKQAVRIIRASHCLISCAP